MRIRVAGVGIELAKEVPPFLDLGLVETLPLAVLLYGDVRGLSHLLCGGKADLDLFLQGVNALRHFVAECPIGDWLGGLLQVLLLQGFLALAHNALHLHPGIGQVGLALADVLLMLHHLVRAQEDLVSGMGQLRCFLDQNIHVSPSRLWARTRTLR